MIYDLALYPASGPGLGHLMRCMALAEWAVELKAKVAVALQHAPGNLAWPCPVIVGAEGYALEFKVAIGDGRVVGPLEAWQIIDGPPEGTDPATPGYIYPHFGATPVAGFPTFVGPQWMPLRKKFSRRREDRNGVWACYRVQAPGMVPADDLWPQWAGGMLCPPSVIAYEAMALGLPVAIHDDHEYPRIAGAMWRTGVASWADNWHQATPTNLIDGLGAKRLLEALL